MEKRKTSILSNGFGKMWLGNHGNVLTINQQTAWCEQEGVRLIIEQTFPSIKVYYLEQESGCEVFCTNDASGEYFPERYFLDSYEDWEYFETLDEAAKFVSKIIGHKVEPSVNAIDKALDKYVEEQEENEDIFYSFHEFKVVED